MAVASCDCLLAARSPEVCPWIGPHASLRAGVEVRGAARDWSVFADGFKGAEVLEDEDDAEFRPIGLAQGGDGALYITDSVQGRIWRVTHEG